MDFLGQFESPFDVNASCLFLQAILAIRLELVSSEVTFIPPLTKSSAARSLQEYVDIWLNDYLCRAEYVPSVHRGKVCFFFLQLSLSC